MYYYSVIYLNKEGNYGCVALDKLSEEELDDELSKANITNVYEMYRHNSLTEQRYEFDKNIIYKVNELNKIN